MELDPKDFQISLVQNLHQAHIYILFSYVLILLQLYLT